MEEYPILDSVFFESDEEEELDNNAPYKVYHVVGQKVGITQRGVERRCREQGLWEGYVVEVLDIIPVCLGRQFAGDQEWWYCDYYGFERGSHYTRFTREQNKLGGRKTVKLNVGIHGMDEDKRQEVRRKAAKSGGKKTMELGVGLYGMTEEDKQKRNRKAGRRAWELGVGIHSKQSLVCEHCGFVGGFGMFRWHGNNCTMKGLIPLPVNVVEYIK
jgi:hypothetical protein